MSSYDQRKTKEKKHLASGLMEIFLKTQEIEGRLEELTAECNTVLMNALKNTQHKADTGRESVQRNVKMFPKQAP